MDPVAPHVTVLSSMATKGLLREMAATYGGRTTLDAIGGVDAARRVRGGAAVDVVVLAGDAMRALEAEGHVLLGTLHAIAVSQLAAAVREGEAPPDLADAEAVRQAVLAAGRIGYSTGPSGDHLLRLLADWGIWDQVGARLVQAPPGVPVGRLLADRVVDLAFQQRSELMGLAGVLVAGVLPPPAGLATVFTAGIARASPRPDAARAFIAFLASPAAADARRKHGLEAA